MIKALFNALRAYAKGEPYEAEVTVTWWEAAAALAIIGLVIYLIVR